MPCPRYLSVSPGSCAGHGLCTLKQRWCTRRFRGTRECERVCLFARARAWLSPVMASFAGDPRSPTAGTQVTEYNVDEDAELERIRMSIADMETTGEYTGLPAGDMKEKQQIKTIPKLVGALEKRMPSQAQWNSKAEKLYDAFANSAQSPSFEYFDPVK